MKSVYKEILYGEQTYSSSYTVIENFYKYITTAVKRLSYATTSSKPVNYITTAIKRT